MLVAVAPAAVGEALVSPRTNVVGPVVSASNVAASIVIGLAVSGA